MNCKNIVKSGYDAIAAEYLKIRAVDSDDTRLLDDLIRRLPKGARILDAGCGAGVPIARKLSHDFEVVGVDFSKEQIKLARQSVPKAEFFCQDMTTLTFGASSFDAVCSYYAIIHIPRAEHKAIFENFYRILKPSGLALLCLGAEDLESDIVDDYLGARMFWSHFDAETNLNLLKSSGFKIIWSKIVPDATSPGPGHLFVLIKKQVI
jgi:ubiquinone/menaquinone biosynthesis C-methylase UbiE